MSKQLREELHPEAIKQIKKLIREYIANINLGEDSLRGFLIEGIAYLEKIKNIIKKEYFELPDLIGQCQVFSVKSHQGFILNGFHSFNYAAIL
jgi:hypothetical protein